ncbi:MAG: chorismate mutase [Rhodobacteraceae bacterium]|nr:chorismate mutase [Paracoccaceae bacterium]
MRAPEDCHSLVQLRALIDRIDRDVVRLLALRQSCIDRAAELKRYEGLPARIPARVEEVVERVREAAEQEGFDVELGETLWRRLIEWSIEREEALLAGPDGTGAEPGT